MQRAVFPLHEERTESSTSSHLNRWIDPTCSALQAELGLNIYIRRSMPVAFQKLIFATDWSSNRQI
jgi:hypothetical protein